MRRRALLGAVGALGLTAGCGARPAPAGEAPPPPTDSAARTEHPLVRHGSPPDVCAESPSPSGIRAIVEPAFGPDWDDVAVPERYRGAADGLSGEQVVIGLEDDGRARAYPLSVVWWHEIVNDRFGGPVIVTYCPRCRSGLVADGRVGGRETTFLVTGLLWQPPDAYAAASAAEGRAFGAAEGDPGAAVRNSGNLVMRDRATGSYWSQLLAAAICGPQAGEDLAIRPSRVTTWAAWRREHPGTGVLLPPPASGLA